MIICFIVMTEWQQVMLLDILPYFLVSKVQMCTYTHVVCVGVCVCGSVVLTNPVVSNDKEGDTPKLIICKLQPAPHVEEKLHISTPD